MTPDGVVALDARVIIDPDAAWNRSGLTPTSRFALIRRSTSEREMQDGTDVTLRPIKPEDEPLWLALLASCSKETIYSRFRYFFHWSPTRWPPGTASSTTTGRSAIVAEVGTEGARSAASRGRAPDRRSGPDDRGVCRARQRRLAEQGPGGLLTDYCLEIARHWGVRSGSRPRPRATIARMVAVFGKRGFRIVNDLESPLVEVSKELL